MNILIIEDDQFFANHLRKSFKTNTIVNRVDIVTCFQGFMSIFSVLEGYDIILTDIRLSLEPNAFDGFQIIKTIRESKIKVPIIVISGRDDLSKIQ
jgi:DNA-binding response OmpR family regulator